MGDKRSLARSVVLGCGGLIILFAMLSLGGYLAIRLVGRRYGSVGRLKPWEPPVTLGQPNPTGAIGVAPRYRSPRPVVTEGPDTWDDRTTQAPSVVWNPDLRLYQMWYDGRGSGSVTAAVGYATSKDDRVWTKHKDNPAIPEDARWPCVLYEPADRKAPYKMWFNVGRGVAIRHARSLDGITWTRSQVVLRRGPRGGYDDMDVAGPRVVKVGKDYWMFYTAGSTRALPRAPSAWSRFLGIFFSTGSAGTVPPGRSSWGHFIALAVSPDGVHWTKREPVVSCGARREWDGVRVFNAAVVRSGGLFEMWYVGGDGGNKVGTRSIGYASSTDGLHWTKHARNPVLFGNRTAGAYDYGVSAPAVLRREDGYKVWFTSLAESGYTYSGVQIGYAEYAPDAWTSVKGPPAAPSAAPPG